MDRTKCASAACLERTTFRTSRLLDFCSRKELIAQTGHQPEEWPLVLLKELVDNALDACEEAEVAPEITITVDDRGVTVADNGPGIPESTVAGMLDFNSRASSREAYVAPDRGAQGNALMTLVAMPFVLDGKRGDIEIVAQGVRHRIVFTVDAIRQKPLITHEPVEVEEKNGTKITVFWPDSASSILDDACDRFLQIADDFTWINPHLRLTIDWSRGTRVERVIEPTAPGWEKWKPSYPTCPHWYEPEHLQRLIVAYIAHDDDNGDARTVSTSPELRSPRVTPSRVTLSFTSNRASSLLSSSSSKKSSATFSITPSVTNAPLPATAVNAAMLRLEFEPPGVSDSAAVGSKAMPLLTFSKSWSTSAWQFATYSGESVKPRSTVARSCPVAIQASTSASAGVRPRTFRYKAVRYG